MADSAASPERQFVEGIEYKPIAHIEIRVGAFFGLPLERIDHVSAVTEIGIEASLRVVDRMRPGICAAE